MLKANRKATGRVFGLLILTLCASASADVLESAAMLPDDMMFMVSVESVSGLRAAAEKTSLYALYKDPAMQEFVTESEKKIRELIETTLKDFWQDMKIENPPEQIPYPEGRLVLGVSPFKAAASDASAEESGGNKLGFRFVVLADMGGQVEQARQMMRSLSTGATNAGRAVAKKDVGGVEMNVLASNEDSNDPTLYYGLKDNWLVIVGDTARGIEFTESVVRRMGRSLPGSLAEKAGLQIAVKTLGDAQIFAFVNADAAKSLIASMASDKAQVERMIKALGFGNVTGFTAALQIAGQKNQEMVYKTLIGIDGPRTGIPALLSEGSGPLKVNDRLVTRDVVGFLCANCAPSKIFDGIAKIVQNAAFVDLNMMVQAGMAATAGEGGQPPVQLRDDVLAQMAAPLLATWRMEKPYTLTGRTEFLVALPALDGGRLDTAVGRIHRAFLGRSPESRRELLGHTLYVLPGRRAPAGPDEEEPSAQQSPANAMAISVAGDSLVFGSVDDVEQAIRSINKEPTNALASDPLFRHARESLPSQACLYAYQNDRLNAEITWTALKQTARDLAEQGRDESDEDEEIDFANPMMTVMQKIKNYVDLSRLPEFKVVEKYWGASVSYMQNRQEGLYGENITLRPPQE